jgi:hypothetical protein
MGKMRQMDGSRVLNFFGGNCSDTSDLTHIDPKFFDELSGFHAVLHAIKERFCR